MSNEDFIQNINLYKKIIRKNDKKYNNRMCILNFIIFSLIFLIGCGIIIFTISNALLIKGGLFNSLLVSLFFTGAILSLLMLALIEMSYSLIGGTIYKLLFGVNEKIEVLEKLKKKDLYMGAIDSIFDLNCASTQKVMKKNKKSLKENILENKGLKTSYIITLLNNIEDMKKKDEVESNKEEEMNALKYADTEVGKMLKTIDGVSN